MEQHRRSDAGRSLLVELVVTMLLIVVVLALAAPAALGAQTRREDRRARHNLRKALAAAEILYAADGSYCGAVQNPGISCPSLDGIGTVEPTLTFNVTPSTRPKQIAATISGGVVGAESEWHAAALARPSATCWYIKSVAPPGVTAVTYYGSDSTLPVCTGAQADVTAANSTF